MVWKELTRRRLENKELRLIIQAKDLPEEIRDQAWEKLLKKHPDCFDFRKIIEDESGKFKVKASEQLLDILQRNPDVYQLLWMIENGPKEFKTKASEQLLTSNPDYYDLRRIIENKSVPKKTKVKIWEQEQLAREKISSVGLCRVIKNEKVPEEIKDQAWEQLLTLKVSEKPFAWMNNLVSIIEQAPEKYKAKASEQLLQEKPRSRYLSEMIKSAPEDYKVKAWEQLLEEEMDDFNRRFYFRKIIQDKDSPEEYRIKAWKEFSKIAFTRVTYRDWTEILQDENVPEQIRDEAWEQLLEKDLETHELRWVIQEVPKKHGAKALKLIEEKIAEGTLEISQIPNKGLINILTNP